MTIRTLAEANALLAAYAAKQPPATDKDLKFDQVKQLMAVLDNPQDKLRVIHIAGTSGKTSTAYYVAALIAAAGKSVGLTTSPHVNGVNERVQINGEPLPETEFCGELTEFMKIVQATDLSPSYFVLLYAFAMWVFVRRGVEYGVTETGIGGLLDATNVATRPDKICIITDIGLDHTDLLGSTLPEITSHKIGIVHEHNHVFMYEQSDEIMRIVRKWTTQHQAPLHIFDEGAERQTQHQALVTRPVYQQRNWLLAYGTYRYLEERDSLKHLTGQVLRQTQTVQVPGRMDIKHIKGKTLVMDGAHNVQKMTAFIGSFQRAYPGVKPAVLLGVRDTKDYDGLIPLMISFASRIIVTTFSAIQDAQIHSTDPEELARTLRHAGMKQVAVMSDQHEAFQALLETPERVCVITGSFYLLGQIRNNEQI